MITNAGYAKISALLGNISAPTGWGTTCFLAYGTGTTAEAANLTALATETARVAGTIYHTSTLYPFDTIVFYALATIATGITLTEIGVFDDSSTGTMLGRKLVSPSYTPATGDQVVLIYEVTVKDGSYVWST